MAARSRTPLALALCLLASCSGTERLWVVDVRTDLVPGIEFAVVVVEAWPASSDPAEPPASRAERPATRGDDFLAGLRVAEWTEFPAGRLRARGRLLDRDAEVVAETAILVEPGDSSATTLVITRSCLGLSCPDGETCVAGACMPSCTEEPCGSQCRLDAECPARADCATAVCVGGSCLYGGEGACGEGAYCDPELGCRSAGLTEDAGSPDGATADSGLVLDAGPDAGGCACEGGAVCCDGACVDLQSDSGNCGSCSVDCTASGHICSAGHCCPPGRAWCEDGCVDLQTDDRHCGACGFTCAAGSSCCSGACADLRTDEAHCGGCGAACLETEECCSGVCEDLQTDDANCGQCGQTCSSLWTCMAGRCRLP